ncbi:MAG: hypothetical protein RIQ59_952 [Bacteroidota bacterium]|jgi:hypothetical protein
MKKISFVLLLLIGKIYGQAQSDINFYFGKVEYINATVNLIDGKRLLGEVQDFDSPNFIEFTNPYDFNPSTLESNNNLDRKKIKFRRNASEKYRTIPSDSINYITYFDKELNKVKEFKRLHILKAKSNGEIVDSGNTVFLPLIKNDSINFYGYNITIKGTGKYARTVFYLNNPKDNFAINPIDFSLMDLMGNKSKIHSKVINAIKAIVKDCPEFTSKLDAKQDVTKEMEKDALQKYQEMEKQVAEGKKNLKTKKEKNAFEAEVYTDYNLRPFLNLTDDYKKMCK